MRQRADSSLRPGLVDPGRSPAIMSCRDLRKSYGPTAALAGVDLDLYAGELLAITGESGSGKSSLLLCLSGILAIDSGSIRFRKQDLVSLPDDELTRLRLDHFGFVFQSGHLVPDLSATLNVAFPLMLSGKRRRESEEAARGLLDELGVGDVADKVPGDMSGGQSQRVAVARALITQPTVIFADEPTGSLDSRNAAFVVGLLAGAARDRGSAIVLVTHSERVSEVADREVTIQDGVILEAV